MLKNAKFFYPKQCVTNINHKNVKKYITKEMFVNIESNVYIKKNLTFWRQQFW